MEAEPIGDPAGAWTARPLGDTGLLLEWRGLDEHRRLAVQRRAELIAGSRLPGVVEVVPGIATVLVSYDPLVVTPAELARALAAAQERSDRQQQSSPRVHVIPVVYGGDDGPDLAAIARQTGLSEAEVVLLHTSQAMPVLMLGFMPGYPYIGDLPAQLRVPRRAAPRVSVAAGSVAIANDQTGIYPSRSPGGWHVIGRTEARLFDPSHEPPALLRAGDLVRFVAL